ncbi:hypothetical protein Tco_0125864 [Tanacetum coccineum]
MTDLTLNTSVPKKTKPTSVKVSPAYVIKKKTENKSPAVPESCSNKKADSSTKQLILTLMEEVKGIKRQIKIPSGTSPSITQFNDHHSDNYEYYPGCEVCGSVTHEPVDYPKKHSNSRKPWITNKRSTKPIEKWVHKRN